MCVAAVETLRATSLQLSRDWPRQCPWHHHHSAGRRLAGSRPCTPDGHVPARIDAEKRVPPARYDTGGLALPHIACGVTENSSLREQRQEILSILGILRKLTQRLTMLFDDHAVAQHYFFSYPIGHQSNKSEFTCKPSAIKTCFELPRRSRKWRRQSQFNDTCPFISNGKSSSRCLISC